MADILNSAQPTDKTTGTPSVPPEPPPTPPAADSLIVPPKPEDKPAESSPPSTKYVGKKKSIKGAILAVILLLLITLPLAVFYVSQQKSQNDIRSRAEEMVYPCPGPCFASCSSNGLCQNTTVPICGGTVNGGKQCCQSCSLNAICDQTRNEYASLITSCLVAPVCNQTNGVWSCADNGTTTTPPPASCNIKNYSPSMAAVACHNINNQSAGQFQGQCVFYHCPNGCTGTCGESNPGVKMVFAPCNSGNLGTDECGQIDTVNGTGSSPGAYCIPSTGCDSLIQCGPSCQKTASTPTPTKAISCPSIQVYKGTDLITDYSTLMPGDNITILVGLTATKIRINGAAFENLTTKDTTTGLWKWDVTIPTDRTNFSIEVQ